MDRRTPIALGIALTVLVACPEPGPAVSAECTEAYAKCKLPSGPLGVCEPLAGAGFRCQPQH